MATEKDNKTKSFVLRIDASNGSLLSTVVAPEGGVVFFAHNKPLTLRHTPVFKLVCR